MTISIMWLVMTSAALLFGAAGGQLDAVGQAVGEGAQSAVELCLSMGGMICLWSAVMELLRRGGISAGLSALLRPLLRRLFPATFRDEAARTALTENVCANLLGLGNAATPAGLRAVQRMHELGGAAAQELGLLVILNTASFQLLPTGIAAVRAAAGAAVPFDILPAIWISSAASVAVGIVCARLLRGSGQA